MKDELKLEGKNHKQIQEAVKTMRAELEDALNQSYREQAERIAQAILEGDPTKLLANLTAATDEYLLNLWGSVVNLLKR